MKSFEEFIAEEKSVFDYLLIEPEEGSREWNIAYNISKLKSDSRYVYRGMNFKEWSALLAQKKIRSMGKGNTRDIQGSYVSDSVQLAGRFAIRAWKDYGKAVLVAFDRSKLVMHPADKGNYWVEWLYASAVVQNWHIHKMK